MHAYTYSVSISNKPWKHVHARSSIIYKRGSERASFSLQTNNLVFYKMIFIDSNWYNISNTTTYLTFAKNVKDESMNKFTASKLIAYNGKMTTNMMKL
jgi:hypothetical protein